MANRLIHSSSPYLLQHAENPVDWYPWGEEAFDRARERDVPVFLSIGYAACHWCHVMAHESFEDPIIAERLERSFVAIKVDREERPDIDSIYMTAVQALTGRGGWPLTVFLTPDKVPFFGGTYFPPAPRYGMASFAQVLDAVSDAWQRRRGEVMQSAAQLRVALASSVQVDEGAVGTPGPGTLASAVRGLLSAYDHENEGWGGIKFPQAMAIEFLLHHAARTGDASAHDMAGGALMAMAKGGLYDHLGGGFHRYTVDAQWRVPHFEKMLYDNALLARVYAQAWRRSKVPFFRWIVEGTLDFVLREMSDPGGGFYSTLDADSEGEEGRFYTWSQAEIGSVLDGDAESFAEAYGVTEEGDLEGRNVLRLEGDLLALDEYAGMRTRLFEARARRTRPGLDDKVIAAWNGFMAAALADAGRILGRPDYVSAARGNLQFLLHSMRGADGLLARTWRRGERGSTGYLVDHAAVIEGLLAMYRATFDVEWVQSAVELAERMIDAFHDGELFYDTATDHEQLIVRPRAVQDSATPSGPAMATRALLRLSALVEDARLRDLALDQLSTVGPSLSRYPLGFGMWLTALELGVGSQREIVLVGRRGSDDTKALAGVIELYAREADTVAIGSPGASAPPLLGDKPLIDDNAAVYVCEASVCGPAIIDRAILEAELEGANE